MLKKIDPVVSENILSNIEIKSGVNFLKQFINSNYNIIIIESWYQPHWYCRLKYSNSYFMTDKLIWTDKASLQLLQNATIPSLFKTHKLNRKQVVSCNKLYINLYRLCVYSISIIPSTRGENWTKINCSMSSSSHLKL